MRLWQRLRQHQLCVHTTQSAHLDRSCQVSTRSRTTGAVIGYHGRMMFA
jgi:hypothetical protein